MKIIGVVGWKDTGKTTLIEKLIGEFDKRNLDTYQKWYFGPVIYFEKYMPVLCQEYMLQGSSCSAHENRPQAYMDHIAWGWIR